MHGKRGKRRAQRPTSPSLWQSPVLPWAQCWAETVAEEPFSSCSRGQQRLGAAVEGR